MTLTIDRSCANCGCSWRGSVECPHCGHLDNVDGIVIVCGWCPSRAALTAEAHAQGLDVSHGMCHACGERVWNDAALASRARLEFRAAVARADAQRTQLAPLAEFGR